MPRLQGIVDYNRDHLSNLIETNLVDYFNWGCIQAGGFVDVPVPTPGVSAPYGKETLIPVHKEGMPDGSVWQAPNSAWVYEEGFEDGVSPTIASGVFVDGTYHETATATSPYAHYLDFARGLVVFASPLPRSSKVQAAHSYRRANFVKSGMPWFQSVVLDGYLTDQSPPGVLGVLQDHRLQTPAVVVEVAGIGGQSGYELGSTNRWTRPDVLFHVLASSKEDRDRISDLVVNQYSNVIAMYDVNARRLAGDFQLDGRGSRREGASPYPELLRRYHYNSMMFREASSASQPTNSALYISTCRVKLELVVGLV